MKTRILVYKNKIIGGIGKLFYQDGYPLSMAIDGYQNAGYEISWLHLIDELLKNGWSKKTIIARLNEEKMYDDVQFDIDLINNFLAADYDKQRKMIFDSLFENKNEAIEWLKTQIEL